MKPDYEPENRTECLNTGGQHSWIWDEDIDDYRCDECGVSESHQED